MKEYDFEKLAIVVAVHGERYLGSIHEEDPKQYIKNCQGNGEAVVLHDAYILALAQQMDRNTGKVNQSIFLVPPDNLMSTSAKELCVVASSWSFPSDDPNSKKKIDALYERANAGESAARAVEAGLHLPGNIQ